MTEWDDYQKQRAEALKSGKHTFSRPKPDPRTCEHRFISTIEKWYGQGRHTVFQCNDCESYLRPQWILVDNLNQPLPPDGGSGKG